MAPIIVLITGANRGIGKGLLEKYLARPNHTVIGTVRDPDHESSSLPWYLLNLTSQSRLTV